MAATVTSTGATVITGDLGLYPGTSITGFPPGLVIGAIHATDAVAQQAQIDALAAYNDLAGQTCNNPLTGDLGGQTLTPGVYCFSTSAGLTGTLTLDAQDDPNAVFVFQIGSTLTTASNSSVSVINGGSYCNVFWQVGSSATLGTTSDFVGNILANTSITLTTGANVSGRALALNAAVTMDSNTVSAVCSPLPVPAAPTLGKGFIPAAIDVNGVSTLTITLSNPNTSGPAIIETLIDKLPSGVGISGTIVSPNAAGRSRPPRTPWASPR